MKVTVQSFLQTVQTMDDAEIREFVENLAVAGPWEFVEDDENPDHPFWYRKWLHATVHGALENDAAVDINMESGLWQVKHGQCPQMRLSAWVDLVDAKAAADDYLRKLGVVLLDH
jgi:hypothetical protein